MNDPRLPLTNDVPASKEHSVGHNATNDPKTADRGGVRVPDLDGVDTTGGGDGPGGHALTNRDRPA